MQFSKDEKTIVLIDGANLYSTAKSLSFDIDYRKVLQFFQKETGLIRAVYYTAMSEDQEYSSIRPLIDWLDYNGYAIITKPTKEFTDAAGRRKIKGSMDIEIAVDVMLASNYADHIVLFTGDGDFKYLIETVQKKGVRVTIISTIQSHPPMIADELRRQADQFIELSDHFDVFGRAGGQARHEHVSDYNDYDDFDN